MYVKYIYMSLKPRSPFVRTVIYPHSFYMTNCTSMRHLFLGGLEKALQEGLIDQFAFHRAACVPEESDEGKGQ